MASPELLVYVTDDDVQAAKRAWLRARDDLSVPNERVAVLRDSLERLWAQQARQVIAEVRARQRR